MKIVQSFWSGNKKDINNNYGWDKAKYNWVSWILSCNQLIKFYDKVELYTDDFGYDILITKLKLPYTKVHVILNELDHYHSDLWAIAKIKVYSLQDEPFMHVDGDVFIWDKFPDNFINSNLFAQNLENTTDYYRKMWNGISSELEYIPNEMLAFHNGETNLCANMGVIGGSDIEFFKLYAEKSFEFVNRNLEVWDKINLFNFNIFFEQELFYELSVLKSKPITFLFDEIWGDNAYIGFGDFHQVPHKRTYLHLLGVFKRNQNICKAMEIYTMKYFPDSYSSLAKLLNQTKNNDFETEFLTPEKVTELTTRFDIEIRDNKFAKDNLLLKRNLNNIGLPSKLNHFFKNKQNFFIIRVSGFKIIPSLENENNSNFSLEINDLNMSPRIIELDQIDEIMLYELSNPIRYFSYIKNMESYFDDEDEDAKKEFLELIQYRLMNYIGLKIISIYE
jgi:hypothetical protein